MTSPDPLLDSLRTAVKTAPEDTSLRLHLAEMLINRGARDEAVGHIAVTLAKEPGNPLAARLMTKVLAEPSAAKKSEDSGDKTNPAKAEHSAADSSKADTSEETFNWSEAESELADVIPPKFVQHDDQDKHAEPERISHRDEIDQLSLEVTETSLRLADVGGMEDVKKRLNAAFLEPMRNPKLRKLFGKSLRGGLLLYGPPGCGKTFIAKAVAGELGAKFLSVGINDVLDMWIGKSERNMHDIFVKARQNAPCVVFLDELDGMGQKRSQSASGGSRNVVNQLLVELDGVHGDNDGVFVLAATNTPWDVDVALRRPGRFDRTVLVLPPDEPARKSILEYHLRDRPISGINLNSLARRTDGLSGADLAYLCEAASERALMASVEAGDIRMIGMADLLAARDEISSSTGAWFAAARNVAMYANSDGVYNDLLAYLKKQKLL